LEDGGPDPGEPRQPRRRDRRHRHVRMAARRVRLLHIVDARVGDEKVEGAEIIGWDTSRASYITQQFGSDGATAYEATLGEEGDSRVGRSETTRFAGRLSADGNTITGDWQLLDEGSGWRPWMEITLSKQAGESPRRHRGRAISSSSRCGDPGGGDRRVYRKSARWPATPLDRATSGRQEIPRIPLRLWPSGASTDQAGWAGGSPNRVLRGFSGSRALGAEDHARTPAHADIIHAGPSLGSRAGAAGPGRRARWT
jgi:hypothetical protein